MVLIGPRGNGKTALLNWFANSLSKKSVDVEHTTPVELPTVDALLRRVRGRRSFSEMVNVSAWLRADVDNKMMGVSGSGGVAAKTSKSKILPDLVRTIGSRTKATPSKSRPLALLIDEAHTMDPAIGRMLLNAGQIASERVPFLLALAGTPDLQNTLGRMQATFWERCNALPLDVLKPEDVKEALETPLEKSGITLSDQSWRRVIEESQGYPFFVQLWGNELWKYGVQQMEDGDKDRIALSVMDLDAAGTLVTTRKLQFYSGRLTELTDQNVLPVARKVAEYFLAKQPAPRPRYDQMLAKVQEVVGDGDNARSALQTLSHRGFVWCPEDKWKPGIPSLMRYITSASGDPKPKDSSAQEAPGP